MAIAGYYALKQSSTPISRKIKEMAVICTRIVGANSSTGNVLWVFQPATGNVSFLHNLQNSIFRTKSAQF